MSHVVSPLGMGWIARFSPPPAGAGGGAHASAGTLFSGGAPARIMGEGSSQEVSVAQGETGGRRRVHLVLPTAFLGAAVLLYLLLQRPEGAAPAAGPALRDYLRLAAATGVWLGIAWLGKRLLGALVLGYSARRASAGRPTLLVGGGSQLLIDIGTGILFAAALLGIAAFVYHLPLGGLLATSGVMAAIIGFAIQRMIADVFSGIALHIEHPFAVGDWLEVAAGLTGRVLTANWRAVHLVTIEGRAVVVPNSALAGNRFTNLNAPFRHFRLKKTICLDYSVPSARAVPILAAAMAATEGVLVDPAPLVLIDECTELGVVYSLNFWVPDYPESFTISRQVVTNALRFLDQDGLAPAYPKRDVAVARAAPRRMESEVHLPTVLGRVPLLQHLDAGAMGMLEQSAHMHEHAAGRRVIEEGQPGSSLFVVVAGLLEVSQRDAADEPQPVGRLMPGDVFGEISLLTGAPRIATVTALTPVTLVEIDKQHLQPVLDAYPEVLARLTDLEAARVLANRAAHRLPRAVEAAIQEKGMADQLRERIRQFFGHDEA
jgi:small-conductance mechanosensitive channel/CRP-like cAMP-binding protein